MGMTLFQNKYRNESTRLPGFDYSQAGYYFITICTEARVHYFGEIVDSAMKLTETGEITLKCWNEIPCHFPFVILDAFVVMPNHVHGIICITEHNETPGTGGDNAGTQNFASLHYGMKNKFGPQSRNMASIIRGFKIGVTKFCRQNKIPFKWQSLFYDHIIRDYPDLQRIRNYIHSNPMNWKEDKFI